MDSSDVCWPCRVDWRPSRLLQGALVTLGVLAMLALLQAGMPWPFATAAAGAGIGLAWRESRRPALSVYWPGRAGPLQLRCGGNEVDAELEGLAIRGRLAVLRVRTPAGRRVLAWARDTLPLPALRELRLLSLHAHRRTPPSTIAG